VTLLRDESMLSLAYREYQPSPQLLPFVRAYFTFGPQEAIANGFELKRTAAFASAASVSPTMMADVATSIVIQSGDAWRVEKIDACGSVAAASLLGPMPMGRSTRIGPHINAAGLYFREGALCYFLALPTDELLGRRVPIEEVFGRSTHDALAIALETSDPSVRLRALEAALIRRLRRASSTADPLVRRFYEQCMRPDEPRSVDAIAHALGVSRQYLARQVRERLGVPPKLVLRIARFQQVLRTIARGSVACADIAADLGYCDQSHLIADFRDFSGTSPAAWLRAGRFHPHCL
jgi:AraC-like DNA-binding protein